MKKVLALFLVAVMLLCCLSACGKDEYGKGYTFKHGYDESYPPYSYLQDDGTYGGFDVDLCKAVCDYLGWEYEGVPFNWDAKDGELSSGACDCIWSGFTVEGREDDYAWSTAYSLNTQCILVADGSGIETLADLEGKIVGVQIDTSAEDLLSDEGDAADVAATFDELKVYENYTVAFNDLKAGAIDAIAIDITTGNYLIKDETGYSMLDEALGQETYAVGFRTEDTALRDKVNEALQALVDDGTYAEIGAKYPEIADFLCLTPAAK